MTRTDQPTVDDLVDATPATRDRYVDFLRAASIGVVVCWHWVFSVTHWRDGELTMPNPIGQVPLLWLATWVLQVMPLFFFVGGHANNASWSACRRDGGTVATFARRRLHRLYRPLVGFVAAWAAFEAIAFALVDGYPGVLRYGRVVFVPLWFLGVYTVVTLLTPLAERAHRQLGVLATIGLGCVIVLGDLGRFEHGIGWLGLVNSLLVFLFAHQLGFHYRDGTFARIGRRGQAGMAAAAGTALVVITSAGPYPQSMVAVGNGEISNMFPTTACIAVLAVFQAALAMLLRPAVAGWLERRSVWRTVVAANGVAMTVFVWHMTALLVVIAVVGMIGYQLPADPTAAWWAVRPFWLVAPGAVLAAGYATLAHVTGRWA